VARSTLTLATLRMKRTSPWLTKNGERSRATRIVCRPAAGNNPAIPRGFNAEKIHAGIDRHEQNGGTRMASGPLLDPTGRNSHFVLEKQLATTTYDCVMTGAGIRLPPKSLSLLEIVINAVQKAAPHASIAFHPRPEDSAEAPARWLQAD
jgi:hypothetical protein